MTASEKRAAGLVLIIISFAAAGRLFVGQQPAEILLRFGNTRIYLLGLASEWLLFLYAYWAISRDSKTIRQVIDPSSVWTVRRWARYAVATAVAGLAWIIFGLVAGMIPALQLRPDQLQHLRTLFPRDTMDRTLWIALSLSAGFCEEFVYRGYLLQQFHRITNRTGAGVVLQAIIYGIAHAALPWQIVLIVTCLGVLFGAVATLQKSLVPGTLLHAVMDIIPGVTA
jgi:membrane protease YdiL (CAAX protease family)